VEEEEEKFTLEIGKTKAQQEVSIIDSSATMALTNSLVVIEGKEFIVFDYIKKEW